MKRLTIRNLMIFALSGAFLCGTVMSASASIITYTDETAWENAVGSFLLEDFDDDLLNPGIAILSNGAGIGGGVFQDVVRTLQALETTITFTPELLAWGATFDFAEDGAGEGIEISLFSGTTKTFVKKLYNGLQYPSIPFKGFFGFTSTVPFDGIVLAGAGQFNGSEEEYTLDNMQYAAVPEPATMLLVGSGLVGLAGFRRKRKRM